MDGTVLTSFLRCAYFLAVCLTLAGGAIDDIDTHLDSGTLFISWLPIPLNLAPQSFPLCWSPDANKYSACNTFIVIGISILLAGKEEDWGDGLKVLRTYIPKICEHQAKRGDVIHYHYVGRLSKDGSVFGKRLVPLNHIATNRQSGQLY